MRIFVFLGLFIFTSCALQRHGVDKMNTIPFEYVGGHLIKIPVQVNSHETYFIFDTGIGINLLSKKMCDQLGCEVEGHYVGQRMSGQEIRVPISHVSKISVANRTQKKADVGVWPMESFFPNEAPFDDIEGFLSLNFFQDQAFTIDYRNQEITLEDRDGLARRELKGISVPVDLKRDGPTLVVFTKLFLPNGKGITVEIDLGSNNLILNKEFMNELGVEPSSEDVRVEKNQDETNHAFTRYFTTINETISLGDASSLKQKDFSVMFQDIIYDGLIGNDFMKNFVVTYDLPNSRLILSPLE